MTALIKILKGFAWFTVTAVIMLVLFETGGWLLLGPPASHMLTQAQRDIQTDFDVTYGIGPQGFRLTACDQKPASAAKLTVIGDSFVFGQGVADGQDFVSKLSCAGWNARNLGSVGQDFLWYDMALTSFVEPDVQAVVLVLYENDFPPKGWSDGPWRLKRSIYAASHTVAMARVVRRNIGNWLHHSEIDTMTLDERLNNPLVVIRGGPNFLGDLAGPDQGEQERLDEAIRDFVHSAQKIAPRAKILLAVAPEAATLSPGHHGLYARLGQKALPVLGQPSRFYAQAAETCRSLAPCRFVETYDAFKAGAGAEYFPHDFHWNARGHELMAGLLNQALAR